MSIEEKLLKIMEASSTVLEEAKKEDPPEEKKEDEKEEADEVDQEPAVKIDNPLTPDLTTSENGEVPPEEESGEKKEVKESVASFKEFREMISEETRTSEFKPMSDQDMLYYPGANNLPSGAKPLAMFHPSNEHAPDGGNHDWIISVGVPDQETQVHVRADNPYDNHVFYKGDESGAMKFIKERKHHIKDYLDNFYNENKTKSLLEEVEDLSEEFKIKTQALFEATVSEKVNTLLEEKQQTLQEEFNNKLNEAIASFETELTDKIDGYFGELSEQWIQNNELALEASIRSELTESFMDGMRKLFESHYVDLPVEKFDIVTSLEEQLNATKESLDSTKALLEQRQKELDSAKRENILNETTQGMTDIESGKFRSMMEEFDYDNAENFSKRAEIIKESFFGPGKKESIKKNPEKQTLELSTKPLLEEVQNVEDKETKPKSEVSVYADWMRQNKG